MDRLVAGYITADGRAFVGPSVMKVALVPFKIGTNPTLARRQMPEPGPGRSVDPDAVLAEMGYRRAQGEHWLHQGFASSVRVEPIPAEEESPPGGGGAVACQ